MANASTYPDTLDGDLRALVPVVTPEGAQDFLQLIADAIANVQTALGTSPQGEYATVGQAVSLLWEELEGLEGLELSNATPQALGTASAGDATAGSRANHVHPLPTLSALTALGVVGSTAGSTGAPVIARVVAITQADYEALTPPAPATLYLIGTFSGGEPLTFTGLALGDQVLDIGEGGGGGGGGGHLVPLVAVYDPEEQLTPGDNIFSAWGDVIALMATAPFDHPKFIEFIPGTDDEDAWRAYVPVAGMPGPGWDLNGAVLRGRYNPPNGSGTFAMAEAGVKFTNWHPTILLGELLGFASQGTAHVWDIPDVYARYTVGSGSVFNGGDATFPTLRFQGDGAIITADDGGLVEPNVLQVESGATVEVRIVNGGFLAPGFARGAGAVAAVLTGTRQFYWSDFAALDCPDLGSFQVQVSSASGATFLPGTGRLSAAGATSAFTLDTLPNIIDIELEEAHTLTVPALLYGLRFTATVRVHNTDVGDQTLTIDNGTNQADTGLLPADYKGLYRMELNGDSIELELLWDTYD